MRPCGHFAARPVRGTEVTRLFHYPIFEPLAKPSNGSQDKEVFYCKASGANGRGLYTEEGFVVLKGSTGRRENVPSIVGTPSERFRAKLIEIGVMRAQGDSVVFEKDHLFNSPSMAAVALTGRSANGWLEWKDESGRTLDELKRQTAS